MPADNLSYWFEADYMVTTDGTGHVTDWVDRANPPDRSWDVHTPSNIGTPPTVLGGEINGLPGIYFGNPRLGGASTWSLTHVGGPGPNNTNVTLSTPYPFGQNQAHILYVVCKVHPGTPNNPGVPSGGGILVTDRDTFSRQLWTLDPAGQTQQRLARTSGGSQHLLFVPQATDYTGISLLILYRWTGTEMYVTVNDGDPLVTSDLLHSELGTTRVFDPVPDGTGNHVLEIGGSSTDETGFQGTIEAVLLAPDTTPNPQTMDYLETKWGPFPMPPLPGVLPP